VESTLHTSHFPKLLVRIQQTFAGDILTSVATVEHDVCSRTDFTCSMWHSSIADVGAPLQGASSVSSPFLTEFTHWQFHMKEQVSLNLPSMTCNTLQLFYPTKYEIL
jgi:hypothetical protein